MNLLSPGIKSERIGEPVKQTPRPVSGIINIIDKIENAYNEITRARKMLLKEEIDSEEARSM